jgi:GTP-binding protein LepA
MIILSASGKTGMGVHDILEQLLNVFLLPKGDLHAPLQALIFDSVFNSFRGIIAYFRIYMAKLRKGDQSKICKYRKNTMLMKLVYCD